MNRLTLPLWSAVWAFTAVLPAQAASITEQRLQEALAWLAADERGGRDTPSPGLDAAAEWLAARFAAAGLQQVVPDSWFHHYSLPGQRLSSVGVVAKLVAGNGDKKTVVELAAESDIRLWRGADTAAGDDEPCTVAQAGDPALQRLLQAESARRPVVVEVEESHPFWLQAAGERTVLGARRAAAKPVFLVRQGALPAPDRAEGAEPRAWTLQWQAGLPENVQVPLRNVMALLPGHEQKDEYVVVSAHYDHIGTGLPVEGDAIYNGADDDASGTTAVVLLAEALAKAGPLRRSVLFVCFSAEEKGLRGSAAFVAEPPVPKAQIVLNVNLEMLGRPEPGRVGKAWITGADLSDFAPLAAAALQRAGVEVVPFGLAAQLFAQSDNWSFARAGIVAHSISAGSLHKDYHRPSDELSRIDTVHMTQIVRGLYEVVVDCANQRERPQWTEKGLQRTGQRQPKR